ncbi:SoxAX cytochrome complex subunit A [Chelatococcus reniformis]|uniref:L-cysteine S-thiosulfotransferase subunit SoxA n=2 Tax=Chelatococcus reniformis TaxID=1494448 RepID=A0A916UV88_9HYPH|nr:sulfur oxidation c-type cytochrome SoxA [Chelatococcus reniformis]GGC88692.1 SoxAX cytochrome complex subunit A [Chelatococcus reniformis]
MAFVLALVLALPCAGEAAAADRRSGSDFMAPETRAMQADDMSNPAMLWVADGEQSWHRPEGAAGRACATCHGDATRSMRGVAARYPAFAEATGRPVDLSGRINLCRRTHQPAPPFASESRELLALTAYVAYQSRGMPIAPPQDPRLDPFRANGGALYERRIGQLDLSCAACHDARWGQQLGGSVIPQAHPTAYPLYRLEWQSVGSLQRRLRNCMVGVRAEPYAFGAPELVDLELFLMGRAGGMALETPGVRP